jgi:hypothetical protein
VVVPARAVIIAGDATGGLSACRMKSAATTAISCAGGIIKSTATAGLTRSGDAPLGFTCSGESYIMLCTGQLRLRLHQDVSEASLTRLHYLGFGLQPVLHVASLWTALVQID